MTLSFALRPADFDRFQKLLHRRLRRRPGTRVAFFAMRAIVWCCIGLMAGTFMHLLRNQPESIGPRMAAGLLATTALVAAAATHASRILVRRHMLAANGSFLSPVTVEFAEHAFVIRSATARTEVAWQGLVDRDEDDANHYLFVDATQAFILPKAEVAPVAEVFERHTAHLPRRGQDAGGRPATSASGPSPAGTPRPPATGAATGRRTP